MRDNHFNKYQNKKQNRRYVNGSDYVISERIADKENCETWKRYRT